MMESIGAIAVIALAIIALVGVFSSTLAAIATIIVGAAILVEGGVLGASPLAQLQEFQAAGGGATAEFLGGGAGIVLGILALFSTAPQTLLAVAVLVFGATFLLGGAAMAQVGWLTSIQGQANRETTSGAGSGQVLVGLAATVLGILAVTGLSPLTLILVALLSLGASMLFSGSAVGTRTLSAAEKRSGE